MGKLETRAKSVRKVQRVQQALLAAVAVPGLLAVAVMAPNVLQILGSFSGNRSKFNYRLKSVAARLVEKGYIRFVTVEGRKCLEITASGRQVLDRSGIEADRRRKWDKRWRLVIFDIPERRRLTRNKLRSSLENYGFVRLQDSVWAYPYDCEDFVALIKADLRSGDTILYLMVEIIENDKYLKDHFGI